jgi:hypothetical protein
MSKKIQARIDEALALETAEERLNAFLAIQFESGLPGMAVLRRRKQVILEGMNAIHARREKRKKGGNIGVQLFAEARAAASRPYGDGPNPIVLLNRNVGREQYRDEKRAEKLGIAYPVDVAADMRRAEKTGDILVAKFVAKKWHSVADNQYQSKYAEFHHGAAIQRQKNIYAKSYGHPARWVDPGVRIDYRSKEIVLESTRGKITRIPSPPKHLLAFRHAIPYGVLVGQDLYAVPAGGRKYNGGESWERWSCVDRTHWTRVGLAVVFPDGSVEHGSSKTEISRELKHKRDAEKARAEERRLAEKNAKIIEKLVRRIARQCQNLIVTVDDARSAGNCRAGINGFKARAGLGEDETSVAAKFLWRHARQDYEGQRILNTIHAAARRVAMQVVAKKEAKNAD